MSTLLAEGSAALLCFEYLSVSRALRISCQDRTFEDMLQRPWRNHVGVILLIAITMALLLSLTSNSASSARKSFVRRRLEAVDFDIGLSELKKYKSEHGNLLVAQSTVVEVNGGESLNLGKWVQRLRQLYKNTVISSSPVGVLYLLKSM